LPSNFFDHATPSPSSGPDNGSFYSSHCLSLTLLGHLIEPGSSSADREPDPGSQETQSSDGDDMDDFIVSDHCSEVSDDTSPTSDDSGSQLSSQEIQAASNGDDSGSPSQENQIVSDGDASESQRSSQENQAASDDISPPSTPQEEKYKGLFKTFIQYLFHFKMDKELSHLSDKDRTYIRDTLRKIENLMFPWAQTLGATCKPPYKATLKERPNIDFTNTDDNSSCAGCWQAGLFICTERGHYRMTSDKGTYNQQTFELEEEKHSEESYVTQTAFPNNALAPYVPYHTTVKVIVGERCFQRGKLFHDVIHFRFKAFQLVSSLCKDPEELKQSMEDPETAFKLMWKKNHFDSLWDQFKDFEKRYDALMPKFQQGF